MAHDVGIDAAAGSEEKRGLRCDGCAHNHYSAMHGLVLGEKPPHSRCSVLGRDIPIVMSTGANKVWTRSEIPPDCPTHKQSRLL